VNITVFNLSILLGWLMFLAGSVMFNVSGGLVASGLLLLVLVLRVAGATGVYQAGKGEETR
jgi:hypothetical protein